MFLTDERALINIHPIDMHKEGQSCTDLIIVTANGLGGPTIALMLEADNLVFSIMQAIQL